MAGMRASLTHSIRGRLFGAAAVALLGAALLAPGAAFADEEEPIVLTAPYRPYWRVVPPSTDPQRPTELVAGVTILRGTVIHHEGDLVLLGIGGPEGLGLDLAVLRVPSADELPVQPIAPGSIIEAIGAANMTPIFDATRVVIYAPPSGA